MLLATRFAAVVVLGSTLAAGTLAPSRSTATDSVSQGRTGSVARGPSTASRREPTLSEEDMSTLFESPVHKLDGTPSSLGAYKGKALLVVNVASKCGLTPQYAELEKLHERLASKGFSVVGFPCNQFGGQEPGTAEQIREFCSATYGVTFPMFEKIEVNGPARHPIYATLTAVKDAEGKAGDVQWNFEKFVISADGKTVTRFRPMTTPDDPVLLAAIEAGLPGN